MGENTKVEKTIMYIYKEVFSKFTNSNIDLFLCGGSSDKKLSYRDQLRHKLEEKKHVSVLYPEDMFMEMLSRKKYDLLTLERFLANNSDYILIVCESPGSFAELGAFVNNNETFEKVIVLLHKKYKNAKSFIRQGPVELVKSKDKNRVIFYNNENLEETISYIRKAIGFRYRFLSKTDLSIKDLDLISGQYNFILMLLYFYNRIEIRTLINNLKKIYIENGFADDKFEVVYSSAIRRLFKDSLITKEQISDGVFCYKLTDKGYFSSKDLLSNVSIKYRTYKYDSIRMRIMYDSLND